MAKTKVKKMAFGGYTGLGNTMSGQSSSATRPQGGGGISPNPGRPVMPPQGGGGISPNPGRPVMPNPGGTAPVAQAIKSALANPQMAQNIGGAFGNALNQSKPGTGSTLEQMPQGMPPPPGMPNISPAAMAMFGPPKMMGGMGMGMKKGGKVSNKPKASSASSRGDGIATKGKTKGRFV